MVSCGALGLLACVALAAAQPLHAAVVEAHVDRDTVYADESFRLTFEARGDDVAEPDFSPLERDFDILGRSRRTNISYGAGGLSRSTTWILNLMPKHAGAVDIPAIDFGGARSPVLPIQVARARTGDTGAAGELFLEVEATPAQPYVQSQVLYTVRIWRRVELDEAEVDEPRVTGGRAVIERLGQDRHYHAERDGRRYAVVERRYALFPQVSGTLEIAPLELDARIIRGTGSLFDPFGHDIATRRLRSAGVELQVRPVPAGYPGREWLPARSLELREVWSDDGPLTVGEPVSRTVAVIADGLTAGQLPELLGPLPADLKGYPEQPVLTDRDGADGVTGVRQEQMTVIASAPGAYEIPAVEVTWWDLEADRPRVARLPARRIEVAAAPAGDAQPPAPAPRTVEETPPPAPPAGTSSRWRLATIALGAAWLATALGWWWNRRRPVDRPTPARSAVDARGVRRVLAYGDPQRARDALLAWSARRWPEDPPHGLRALARRCPDALRREIERLDAALYGRGTPAYDGAALAAAFAAFAGEAEGAAQRPSELDPLYPR